MARESRWSRYWRIVSRVPRGRVTTYGEIASLAGRPRGAREVGYALSSLRGAAHRVPWQRVLGKRAGAFAGISLLDPMGAGVQRDLLEREGVVFDERGRVSLQRYGWPPEVALRSGSRSRSGSPFDYGRAARALRSGRTDERPRSRSRSR